MYYHYLHSHPCYHIATESVDIDARMSDKCLSQTLGLACQSSDLEIHQDIWGMLDLILVQDSLPIASTTHNQHQGWCQIRLNATRRWDRATLDLITRTIQPCRWHSSLEMRSWQWPRSNLSRESNRMANRGTSFRSFARVLGLDHNLHGNSWTGWSNYQR